MPKMNEKYIKLFNKLKKSHQDIILEMGDRKANLNDIYQAIQWLYEFGDKLTQYNRR